MHEPIVDDPNILSPRVGLLSVSEPGVPVFLGPSYLKKADMTIPRYFHGDSRLSLVHNPEIPGPKYCGLINIR